MKPDPQKPITENNAKPLTSDEIRTAVKHAHNMSGPSDATQPGEYVLAGALALLSKLRAEGVQAGDEETSPIAPDDEAISDAWITASDIDGIAYDGPSFERGYRLGEIAERDRAALASAPVADDWPARWEAMRHAGNEWADMACNAISWMRNVQEGVHTAEEALEGLKKNLAHCRATQALAPVLPAPVAGAGDEREAVSNYQRYEIAYAREVLSKHNAQHPDDIAVDRFAAAMKAKLAKKRADGRGGWQDKDECSAEFLSKLLRNHIEKGDPLDVGNFAMMLHQRGERIAALASAPVAALTIGDACARLDFLEGAVDHQTYMRIAHELVEASASAPVAGEAREPIGEVFRHGEGRDENGPRVGIRMLPAAAGLPHGTQVYAAPQASEAVPLSQYGYQALFNAIGEAVKARDKDYLEISVQAFREALKTQSDKDGGDCAKGAPQASEALATKGWIVPAGPYGTLKVGEQAVGQWFYNHATCTLYTRAILAQGGWTTWLKHQPEEES